MYPVLLDFGSIEIGGVTIPLVIGGYGLMFALGIVSGWLWMVHLGRQIDPDVRWTDLYFTTIISGFLGAKVANLIVFLPALLAGRASWIGVARGGGVWLGGVIAGVGVCYLYARRNHLPVGKVFNVFFVAIPFGHAIGRIGCLLGGCCYGSVCEMPWAVTYTSELAHRINGTPLGVPLHPTVVYESILELANFAVCYTLWRNKPRDWTILVVWAGLYGAERFVLEFFRSDARGSAGALSTSQWLSLGMVGVSLLALRALLARRRA